jgi:regulatory protein
MEQDHKAKKATRPKSTMKAYDRMVMLLSRRDHSERELVEKLKKAEHPLEEIEAAIEFAKEKNWLPDESVLAVRESTRLARAGKSPSQITAWLRKKGLPTKGLEIPEEDKVNEEESAYKTAIKSWSRLVRTAERDVEKAAKKKAAGGKRSSWGGPASGLGLEETLKSRVTRLLMSRGFTSTTARMVFNRLLSENPL